MWSYAEKVFSWATHRRILVEGLALTLAFAFLTAFFFRSLFQSPANSVIKEGPLVMPDVYLTLWILSWDWHALTTNPWKLFHANAFYPAPYALAGSEHMLGHLVIFGPVFGITGNPVLAYQTNLFLSLTLSGTAAYALFRYWRAAIPAALFGGFVYAFFPGRAGVVGHAHLVAGQYLPLALLFLTRTLFEARWRYAAAFGVFLLLQMLCSYYLAYPAVFAAAAYGLVLLTSRKVTRRGVCLAAAVGVLVLGVFALLSVPYLLLASQGVVPDYRTSPWLRITSASLWENYLYPPVALRKWGWRLPKGMSAYLGFLPLAFAVCALVPRRKWPHSALYAWAAVAVFLSGWVLALGPEVWVGQRVFTTPYNVLLNFVPGLGAVRVPSRFALLFVLGFAGLAALGFARVVGQRLLLGWTVLFPALAGTSWEYGLFEVSHVLQPLPTRATSVYRDLTGLPAGPVLEIPAWHSDGDLQGLLRESRYLFSSIYHRRPLLNGYSGYRPPTYTLLMRLAGVLPDPAALSLLQRTTGLKYVIVHLSDLPPAERGRWKTPPGLRLLARRGDDLLYATTETVPADLKDELLRLGARDRTILGVPLRPLPASHQKANLDIATKPSPVAFPGLPYPLDLTVENKGEDPWPVLAPNREHLVEIGVEWQRADGSLAQSGSLVRSGLPYDVFPGETVRAPVMIPAPRAPGRYRLYVGVAQDGQWFPERLGPLEVEVRLLSR